MNEQDRPSVCVVGSLNMDLVVRTPHLPAPGETVLGGPWRTFPGGKGANQAVACARLGATTTMIGCVGDDPFGHELTEQLEADHVEVRLDRDEEHATGVATITVDEHGQNTIVVDGGANLALSVAAIGRSRECIEAASWLVTQLETPPETVEAAARVAADADTRVLLNAAPACELSDRLLALVDVLVVNRGEAALVAGRPETDEPLELAHALAETGAKAVVVTLGAQGAVAVEGDREYRLGAFEVESRDAVGAGDSFVSALAVELARGAAFEPALRFASAAGALTTTREGAQASLPTRRDVETFLEASS